MRFLPPVLLLGLVACTGAPATERAGDATQPDSATQEGGEWVVIAPVALPDDLADFSLVDIYEYPDPTLGMRVRYAAPSGLRADVFLYPIIPTALARSRPARDSAAANEFERAKIDIETWRAQEGLPAPKPVNEAALQLPAETGNTAVGHRATVSLHEQGIDWYSHLYVIAAQDTYVKVRATYPQAGRTPEPPPALAEFVQALFAAVIAGHRKKLAEPALPRA
jgi:hypothetical protein